MRQVSVTPTSPVSVFYAICRSIHLGRSTRLCCAAVCSSQPAMSEHLKPGLGAVLLGGNGSRSMAMCGALLFGGGDASVCEWVEPVGSIEEGVAFSVSGVCGFLEEEEWLYA